jgi:hypothetical protein
MCRASLVLAIAAIASACAEPPPAHAPVVPPPTREELAASVDSLYAHLVRAAESGDAPAYAASFAPAGAVLLPNRPAIAGRPALTAWAAEFFATWEVRRPVRQSGLRAIGPGDGTCHGPGARRWRSIRSTSIRSCGIPPAPGSWQPTWSIATSKRGLSGTSWPSPGGRRPTRASSGRAPSLRFPRRARR